MFKKKRKTNLRGIRPLSAPGSQWRGYQQRIQLHDEKRQARRRIAYYFISLLILAACIEGGFYILKKRLPSYTDMPVSLYPPDVDPIDTDGLRALLEPGILYNPTGSEIEFLSGQHKYQLYTGIDTDLQKAVLRSFDTRHANRIGIVAMDPGTGRVLAMASHDADDPDRNACFAADLPAASIYKIVTAAAAIEKTELDYGSNIPFNGGKFTLYRNQLTDQIHQYTNYTTLKAAFAESINPVFGKLGKNELGKSLLEEYGHAYLFGRGTDFDLAVQQSVLEISNTPYHWAEIASGFNRETTVSPLHAAMIAASIVNDGEMMRPWVVRAAARDNQTIYRYQPEVLSRTVRPETAKTMRMLMEATIREGTARNQFRRTGSDPVLSRLEMGGKTGSINNNRRQIRYDWFTGYAIDPGGSGDIAIGVIVAHKEYIGKRAAAYFQDAVKHYFKGRIGDDGQEG